MTKEIAKTTEPCRDCVRPVADVLEQEEGFHLLMDMPGVGRDGLNVDLHGDEVTVHGTSGYKPFDTARPVHSEFMPLEFRRSFTLSDAIDRDGVTANLKDGVLDLFLPKAAESVPRRIEIQAG